MTSGRDLGAVTERVVGRALAALPAAARAAVRVATKSGLRIDEASRTGGGTDVRPAAIRAECDASLRRLGVDAIDRYQLHGLVALARSPLAMGLLSGKYDARNRPAPGDARLDAPWWTYFDEGSMQDWLRRLDAVRELLTTGGRTLVQGSPGYLRAVDPAIIPLPGVRTVQQAVENAEALALGPLPADVAAQVTTLLADSPERS